MGIKFLNQFQLLPWCFPLMGTLGHHCVSDDADAPSSEPIKLIKSDGHVSVYHRPVHASELMTEFPKHLVCHSDDFYIGRKIPALSEHDQLQLGQKYFLLPNHFFQSVLSFVTVASFMASQPQTAPISGAIKRAAAQNQLFDVQKTPSGFLRIRVSDEFISRLIEEGKGISDEAGDGGDGDKTVNNSRVCTTAQLEKDYEQMVVGSRTRQWKPKLEMITEGKEKKHKRRFSNSFGIKRRRSNCSKSESQSQPQRHQRSEISTNLAVVACPSKKLPSPKPRIRTRSRT